MNQLTFRKASVNEQTKKLENTQMINEGNASFTVPVFQ